MLAVYLRLCNKYNNKYNNTKLKNDTKRKEIYPWLKIYTPYARNILIFYDIRSKVAIPHEWPRVFETALGGYICHGLYSCRRLLLKSRWFYRNKRYTIRKIIYMPFFWCWINCHAPIVCSLIAYTAVIVRRPHRSNYGSVLFRAFSAWLIL